jgi:molybdopterin converting factor small subunit
VTNVTNVTPVTAGHPNVVVRIPAQLRQLTGGKAEVEAAGTTVAEVLDSLDRTHAGLRERVIDDGKLRRFVNVFVADEDVRFLDGLATPVAGGQTISIVPAIAGG